jgi:hypothetical protein
MIDSTNETAWEGDMKNETNRRPIPTSYKEMLSTDPTTKECVEEMLMNSLNDDYINTRNQLIGELERGQREINNALENINKGYGVNSMGILQSTGRNIDTLCAQLRTAAETEQKVAYALGFDKPSADTCWK